MPEKYGSRSGVRKANERLSIQGKKDNPILNEHTLDLRRRLSEIKAKKAANRKTKGLDNQ